MSFKNQLKKAAFLGLVFSLLLFTRFYNLSWGLPFPFHPDERNMAVAVMKLSCKSLKSCLKPDFYAYGQLPLYFSYFFNLAKDLLNKNPFDITFSEATLGLRFFSALTSLGVVFYLFKIAKIFLKEKDLLWFVFIVIFSPFLIQFSHFGTTESVLMLSFVALTFYSLQILISKKVPVLKLSLFLGIGISSKITALSFIFIPFFAFAISRKFDFSEIFYFLTLILSLAVFISFLFSPYNFLAYNDFFHSLSYEIPVAGGEIKVFYTYQFEQSLPVVFQVLNILPYSLGIVLTLLLIAGIFLLENKKEVLFLKFVFLFFFFSQSFLYTKWTRFLAPAFPIGLFLGFLMLRKIKNRFLFSFLFFLIVVQGAAFFKVYAKEDPRFSASRWMLENIPLSSVILSETANVIDLPVIKDDFLFYGSYPYYYSFDFYNLDKDENLKKDFYKILSQADYIIVPSRRVFLNYTCFYPESSKLSLWQRRIYFLGFKRDVCKKRKQTFPLLNQYYKKLFDGSLGFELVAEFKNYPQFLFFKFPDELSEETFTVFDHPVIRVYKRKNANLSF